MPLFADALVTVGSDIESLLEDEIRDIARAGTWLTAEERLAVVEGAREARAEARLQARVPHTGTPPRDLLPGSAFALIERLANTPRQLTRDDYQQARAAGMSDGEYLEIVSLVSRIVNIDVLARGIGSVPPTLHDPVDGEPTYDEPRTVAEGAWLPTVPAGRTADAAAAYGSEAPQPFIYRALSGVPAEARRCIAGGDVLYLPLDKFMDFNYSHHPGLNRVQVEIVAARVSALNDCFY